MSREREVKFGYSHESGETMAHFGIAPPIEPEEAEEVLGYVLAHSDACTATGEIPEQELLDDTQPSHTEIVLKDFEGNPRCVLDAIKIQLGKQGYQPQIDILPKPIIPSLRIEIDAYFREGAPRQILPAD